MKQESPRFIGESVNVTALKEDEITGSLEDAAKRKRSTYVIMYGMVHSDDENNYLSLRGNFYTAIEKLDK